MTKIVSHFCLIAWLNICSILNRKSCSSFLGLFLSGGGRKKIFAGPRNQAGGERDRESKFPFPKVVSLLKRFGRHVHARGDNRIFRVKNLLLWCGRPPPPNTQEKLLRITLIFAPKMRLSPLPLK